MQLFPLQLHPNCCLLPRPTSLCFVLIRMGATFHTPPYSINLLVPKWKDAYITSIYQRCFKLGAHFSISECMTHTNRYRNEKKKKQTQVSMVNSEHIESDERNGESCRTILIKHMCFPMRNSNWIRAHMPFFVAQLSQSSEVIEFEELFNSSRWANGICGVGR